MRPHRLWYGHRPDRSGIAFGTDIEIRLFLHRHPAGQRQASSMNLVSMLLVIAAATLLIGAGLFSLIHDLLGRGPHDAPLIEDDWPPRHPAAPPPPERTATSLRAHVEGGSRL